MYFACGNCSDILSSVYDLPLERFPSTTVSPVEIHKPSSKTSNRAWPSAGDSETFVLSIKAYLMLDREISSTSTYVCRLVFS